MDAVTFSAEERLLKYERVPIPIIKKIDDVLIKVQYCGVCGTDLHIKKGEFPCKSGSNKLILGHEFSGTVVNCGSGVKSLRKGDRVAVDPNDSCNCCHFCRNGKPHFCTGNNNNVGTFKDGGWAEYAVIPERMVHKLPDNIDTKQAALLEPLSCVAHGWDIVSPLTVGEKILILGAGIIGSLWVSTLHLQGHRDITVSEPNSIKRNNLEHLNTGCKLITPKLLEQHKDDDSFKFAVIIDCSGNAAAIEQAFLHLENGGKLCCFGVAPPNAYMNIKPSMKEWKIFGTKVNPYSFVKAIGLAKTMLGRYLNYNSLGITVFPLNHYNEALAAMEKGTITKAVFEI